MGNWWGKGRPTGVNPANGDLQRRRPTKNTQVDPTKPPQPKKPPKQQGS